MANLKDIRSRIASVKSTQKITGAMKMVSAAKLKRAQENITNLRPYAVNLLSLIADIAVTQRVSHPLLRRQEEVKKVLLVVITSDRGLCGGFNNSISKFAEEYYRNHKSKYEKLDTLIIGKKAAEYLKRREIPSIDVILNLSKVISYELASEIAERLMKAFTSGEYDEIRFIYNEFKSVLAQELRSETILPVDISSSDLNADDNRFAKDLIFEPKPEVMIEKLLFKHFVVQVYRCLSESVAGEHAARMTAMDSATNNADDMISDLTLTYNKVRQAAITTELTEICSGAEALA